MSQPTEMVAVFTAFNLAKTYGSPAGPVVVLRGASFKIHDGITALIGPSGEGKTTLLNILGGLDRPTSGNVFFGAKPIPYDDKAALLEYRKYDVAWVFQGLNLLGHFRALDNAALPLHCRGVARREAEDAARVALESLHIGHLSDRFPAELSRGQKQRVAVARAFASGARVILADEPTGSLDPASAEETMRAFRTLSRRTGTPVVLVTHNPKLARDYGDHLYVCQGGAVVPEARPVPRPPRAVPPPPPQASPEDLERYVARVVSHKKASQKRPDPGVKPGERPGDDAPYFQLYAEHCSD